MEAGLSIKVPNDYLVFGAAIAIDVVVPSFTVTCAVLGFPSLVFIPWICVFVFLFRLTMSGTWQNAFFIPGLTIGDLIGSVTIMPGDPYLTGFQLGAPIHSTKRTYLTIPHDTFLCRPIRRFRGCDFLSCSFRRHRHHWRLWHQRFDYRQGLHVNRHYQVWAGGCLNALVPTVRRPISPGVLFVSFSWSRCFFYGTVTKLTMGVFFRSVLKVTCMCSPLLFFFF